MAVTFPMQRPCPHGGECRYVCTLIELGTIMQLVREWKAEDWTILATRHSEMLGASPAPLRVSDAGCASCMRQPMASRPGVSADGVSSWGVTVRLLAVPGSAPSGHVTPSMDVTALLLRSERDHTAAGSPASRRCCEPVPQAGLTSPWQGQHMRQQSRGSCGGRTGTRSWSWQAGSHR